MRYFYDVVFYDTYYNKYHVKFLLKDKLPKAALSFFLKRTVMSRLPCNRIVYKSLHFKVSKVGY